YAGTKTIVKRLLSIVVCVLMLFCINTVIFAGQDQPTEARRVRQIAMSGDGQVLAAVYDEFGSTVIDVFDANTMELIETIDLAPSRPSHIALSPNGERVLWYGGTENFITTAIYDRETQSNDGVPGPYFAEDITWNPVNDVIAYAMGAGIDLYDTDEHV